MSGAAGGGLPGVRDPGYDAAAAPAGRLGEALIPPCRRNPR
jgi:hypothetical protein